MIQLQDVTRIHRRGDTEVRALRGVTCEFPAGSFNFLVGPSGSGKSTLLYLIGALDSPTSGKILVLGRNLLALSSGQRDEYRRDEVGFVFQSFNLLSNLTAVENVLIPYRPVGITAQLRERAVKLLSRVGLSDRLHHRPNQLSGGEQQRVAIARALLKQPSLVLADEPTGELDSENGAEVFAALRSLCQEQGSTVVVATHDLSNLQEHDRVLNLCDGLIVND